MARWFVDGRWTKHMPSAVKEMLLSRDLVPPKVREGSLGLVHWSAHDPSKWGSKHAQALIDAMSLMYELEIPEEEAAERFLRLEQWAMEKAGLGSHMADIQEPFAGYNWSGMAHDFTYVKPELKAAMEVSLKEQVSVQRAMYDMEKDLRVAERANRGPIAWHKARKAHEFEVKAYGAKPIKWPSWKAVAYSTDALEAIDRLKESPERLNKRLTKIAKKQARGLGPPPREQAGPVQYRGHLAAEVRTKRCPSIQNVRAVSPTGEIHAGVQKSNAMRAARHPGETFGGIGWYGGQNRTEECARCLRPHRKAPIIVGACALVVSSL